MHCRLQIATLIAPLVLGIAACVHRRLPPLDPAASLRVRVMLQGNENENLRTFIAQKFRVAPRPALPTAWLPLSSGGAGMVALASQERRSWIFVLQEARSSGPPFISVFRVSHRQEGEAAASVADTSKPHGAPWPPCEAWSAFFLKGVGDLPKHPVVLSRWQNDGPSRSLSVDPARHTLVMRPVLRFSTRDIKELRNRQATFLLGITVTAGTKPFVLIGLVRRPDGSYTEAAFVPKPQETGWGGFIHTPGETTEISFYALDDPPAFHTACRASSG